MPVLLCVSLHPLSKTRNNNAISIHQIILYQPPLIVRRGITQRIAQKRPHKPTLFQQLLIHPQKNPVLHDIDQFRNQFLILRFHGRIPSRRSTAPIAHLESILLIVVQIVHSPLFPGIINQLVHRSRFPFRQTVQRSSQFRIHRYLLGTRYSQEHHCRQIYCYLFHYIVIFCY